MSTKEEVIGRLKESRPPATDAFTYLTIIEKSLSPDIIPFLEDLLDDVELTGDIGWDLVEMLMPYLPESEACLEKIARLGNPREVILKALQVMEKTCDPLGEDASEDVDRDFGTLTGMLGILHGRLRVRSPSRFLRTTLDTTLRLYDPSSAAQTAAVIDLTRSLSPRKKRPPLPSRQSSAKIETPFQGSDASKRAPDPEADEEDARVHEAEPALIEKLLQCFLTCVIENYVNGNALEWASRLLEYLIPERIVPRRPTMMAAFNEIDEFRERDALMGQLVAATSDLGLSNFTQETLKQVFEGPVLSEPLAGEDDFKTAQDVTMSTEGLICLLAYRLFASDVFDADYTIPDMSIFNDQHDLLKRYLDGRDEASVQGLFAHNPGTSEALLVMSMYLANHDSMKPPNAGSSATYMSFIHLITLVSLFHPVVRVRNAATVLAGQVLHANPDEEDRLATLEDLLENCMFAPLQACAVTWLREEIIAAAKGASPESPFASPHCFTNLQYTLFPDLSHLKSESDPNTLLEFWTENAVFHLQVANFALFLLEGKAYKSLVPEGMGSAVEMRYIEPLVSLSKTLSRAVEKGEIAGEKEEHGELLMQLSILEHTLGQITL